MPVPIEELKLDIVHDATGQAIAARAGAAAGPALVVREVPQDEPRPERWQLVPVQAAPGGQDAEDPAWVVRDAGGGLVLDTPAAPGGAVRREKAAAGRKGQQWRFVPVEGEAGLYAIEGVQDGSVLELGEPAEDGTPVVLGVWDEEAAGQRWRLVPAEPARTSEPVLRYAPLSHWNGRRSWRLGPSPALRPIPGATPAFSDVLLVLERYGNAKEAGAWASPDAVLPAPARPVTGGQPGGWAGPGARFLADVTGTGRQELVGFDPAKGAMASAGRGDGTFADEPRVLRPAAPAPHPADLLTVASLNGEDRPALLVLGADGVRTCAQGDDGTFTPPSGELALKAFGHGAQAGGWRADRHPRFLADTTGDGRLDLVGCHDDGVWVSLQDEDGKFAPLSDEPALRAFGHAEDAGGWRADRHPRFLTDTTGDGRLDLVGCHDDGVWVSLQDEDGTFAEPLYVLDEFGVEQGWSSVTEHPRFLLATTPDGPADLVGFGPQGVVAARGRGDGTFGPARLVLNDFGQAQGWTGARHPRLLADVTGDGLLDIVGFGDEGVWVAHGRGEGRFEQAQFVCRGFGHADDAGAWRVGRHPRFLADVTGDGRLDLVGFGGPGVYVARNLFRHFRTR
ncbi:FG-GAP-like repeat-containing protein [Streptomyces koyangensis]|uniref:FG-GAP-like repeat-containing protein n=1 Tax=Streptomyces koyangensis TaxID=188770 RepID=UPI0033937020